VLAEPGARRIALQRARVEGRITVVLRTEPVGAIVIRQFKSLLGDGGRGA
jgi:hypothetical protein